MMLHKVCQQYHSFLYIFAQLDYKKIIKFIKR